MNNCEECKKLTGGLCGGCLKKQKTNMTQSLKQWQEKKMEEYKKLFGLCDYDNCDGCIKEIKWIKKALKEQVEEIKKWAENENKEIAKKHYDGNKLRTAEDFYGISAEGWSEIIRLEDGIKMANTKLINYLDN